METNALRKKIIKDVTTEFSKYHIWADINPHPIIDTIIDVDIDGDWKHEHITAQHIMEMHNCHLIGKDIDESDEDCYHAVHHYTISI